MSIEKMQAMEKSLSAGAGSIEKACRILKALTDHRLSRLTDIASHCGFEKSTAMRVLDTLIKEGFVHRDPTTKRYSLGPEIAYIAESVSEKINWKSIARPSLLRLSGQFEDTAILSVLTGIETVCVDVQTGTYPIQVNFQQVGSRRTLGVGSGGVILLAMLSDAEREAALSQIPLRLAQYPGITPSLLEERIGAAKATGYATLFDVVVPQMGGIAVAVRDNHGRPVAALSIAALSDRITAREAMMAAALKREAIAIEKQLVSSRTRLPITSNKVMSQ